MSWLQRLVTRWWRPTRSARMPEPRHRPVAVVPAAERDPIPAALSRLRLADDLLRRPLRNLGVVYGAEQLRVLRHSLKAVAWAARSGIAPPSVHRQDCRRLASRYHETWLAASISSLAQNQALESLVRELAWALAAPSEGHRAAPVIVVSARDLDSRSQAAAIFDRHPRAQLVAWLGFEIPEFRLLQSIAESGKFTLHSGKTAFPLVPRNSPRSTRCLNAARVCRSAGDKGTAWFRLSPVAGLIQALRVERIRGAWLEVLPPQGFVGLDRFISIEEAQRRMEDACIPLIAPAPGDPGILVPRGGWSRQLGDPAIPRGKNDETRRSSGDHGR